MFSSTSSILLPQDTIANLHFPRRLLLQFYRTQTPTPTPAPNYQINPSSTTNGHSHFDANLIIAITILLCALICSLCVNFLIKCMLRCANFITREPNYYIYTCNHGLNMGINKRLLRSFPLVKYSKDQGKIDQVLSTQCVICLSEYRKGDKLRILPKCNHDFHVKCIDKWLESHSSCPTCRCSLVDTCQRIIGCDHPQANSSGEMVTVGVVPQEREDFVRDYRG